MNKWDDLGGFPMIFGLTPTYPSSHNHGSGKWPAKGDEIKSFSRPPFSTSMIMGGRVNPHK